MYTTNLKNIMLMKEISHKSTHLVLLHLYEMFRIGHFMDAESRFVAPKGRRLGKMGSDMDFCFVLGG